NQRVLKVTYKVFTESKPFTFFFHPYYLKQFNNRWFVLGYNEEEDNQKWNMALDRIQDLEETDRPYQQFDFNWEDHFAEIVGVTHYDEAPQEVKLLFNEEAKPYVQTKPLHLTQKTKAVEKGLEVRINVIPNFELQKLLLSYGDQV